MTFNGLKDHPSAKGARIGGISGKFTVDRLGYNVGDGRFVDLGLVGKDVDIEVEMEIIEK